MSSSLSDNVSLLLAADWQTPHGAPPFSEVVPEAFVPAIKAAIEENKLEIDTIAKATEPASFENTIAALERSGKSLSQVTAIFFNLASAHTNPVLQQAERDVSPLLARHSSDLYANERLYKRVASLYEKRESLGLTGEQTEVLRRTHQNFVRAGASLDVAGKARLKEIMEELAGLSTRFGQNVLKDESDYTLVLETEEDLVGLPGFVRDAAAAEAEARGHSGKWAITLSRSSIEPFLQFSEKRELREEAFQAWIERGDKGETDNKPIIAEILRLRIERANLLGFDTFADFKLDNTMAKTPGAALDLLRRVWAPAVERAEEERRDLQQLIQDEGQNFSVKPHDWRFYAEKLRKERFDLEEAEIKPYFQLDQIIAAAFDVAHRLFDLCFEEHHDVPVYHPDVRVWEVKRTDGSLVGLFFGDYFARPSKRSGAWMTGFRVQQKLDGPVTPHIVNVCNFVKGGDGKPALLSLMDAQTLFHEFGHGLHGLLSDVTYPSISGTGVARDFVELPSQLYEHWLLQPAVLKQFATHAETGEPIPDALIDKILKARTFNQGFETVEFTASALVDMAVHALSADEVPQSGVEVAGLEQKLLQDIGMPEAIVMRHRSPHFAHIYSGDGYSAGYYSYMWAEVLDADGFNAFKEAGDIFDPETAQRLLSNIYSAGGSVDPAELYRSFRGRDPQVDPLLEGRGFPVT